ncbi:MAG: class I tRNA ligase family protein [Syntrophotaleaceae bacterium]
MSRSTAMVNKYFAGVLPPAGTLNDLDLAFIDQFAPVIERVDQLMNEQAFNKALQSIWELISAANKYIDDSSPWALAKDPAQQERLGTVLYNLLEAVRIVALLVGPFLPETAERILQALGQAEADLSLGDNSRWGLLQPGTTIDKTKPLFPRIEVE